MSFIKNGSGRSAREGAKKPFAWSGLVIPRFWRICIVRGETPQSFRFQGDSNPGEAIVHRLRELSIKIVFLRKDLIILQKIAERWFCKSPDARHA
jgi:hypothetical protein